MGMMFARNVILAHVQEVRSNMKLKEYATPDRDLFYFLAYPEADMMLGPYYFLKGDVFLWETGLPETLDGDTEIKVLPLPPRPVPPNEPWMDCRHTTLHEMRQVFRQYIRKVEAYADALQAGRRGRLGDAEAILEALAMEGCNNPDSDDSECGGACLPCSARAHLGRNS